MASNGKKGKKTEKWNKNVAAAKNEVTTVADSEYKLPLFQKRAWLTLLSRVWQTSHLEMENPVSLISGLTYSEFSLNLLSETGPWPSG